MKRCPNCNREYSDASLEFCLEDGSRLVSSLGTSLPQTIILPNTSPVLPTEKINIPLQKAPQTIDINKVKTTVQEKSQAVKENVVNKSIKVLEVLPIIISLAHNYWQWLYVTNQNSSDLMSFIISTHFLVWLFLLIVGAIFSLIAIKYGQNKGFAYTSLVILAINFILFLVPRR